ncbi:hypothetical protein M408DRAFT_162243 [Serendipita vermifera MAFF 305830]|uniref:F-box domain-containing protein n=1 Tax=Serendipita vermifera MAFF 305830 TaxID=933852 RepID=A0A0C3AJ15_SERVB|nr:hypothetical protein M408DRAFT_162243 [Serendipita vermifera MAFF 305830]
MSEVSQYPNPGIHKIPDELLVDILKFTLRDDIPSQDLAIVCKRWKLLLLKTPIFWRKMRAGFVPDNQVIFHSTRLRRRLELSRSALIDVVLDVSGFRDEYSKCLFEIIATAGLQRWRSLTLETTGRIIPIDCIAGIFSGTFTSLRSLYIEVTLGDDPYTPIYDLIAKSPPIITFLYSDKRVPDLLLNGRVIKKVIDLVIPASLYVEVSKRTSIESVHITGGYIVNPSLTPTLPKRVTMTTASNESLAGLDLSRVQDLQLSYYSEWGGDAKLSLPSLISLALPKNVGLVRLFDAPLLVSLKLGHDSLWGKEKVVESRKIVELFQKDHDQISMAPTSVEIYLNTTAASVIAVLSHWHQVQHLQLILTQGDRFAWEGAFAKRLKTAKNPLCPNLITLTLRTPWDQKESARWSQTSRAIFKARKLGPLELISWTHELDVPKTKVFVAREDIDGV